MHGLIKATENSNLGRNWSLTVRLIVQTTLIRSGTVPSLVATRFAGAAAQKTTEPAPDLLLYMHTASKFESWRESNMACISWVFAIDHLFFLEVFRVSLSSSALAKEDGAWIEFLGRIRILLAHLLEHFCL